MAKKRGAPTKSESTAKVALFQIRLTAAEKEAFRLAADSDGKKISEWVRDRLRKISRQELEALGLDVPFLQPSK